MVEFIVYWFTVSNYKILMKGGKTMKLRVLALAAVFAVAAVSMVSCIPLPI
ncbi:hypothetical protein [Ruminococcus flavefaciens]|uniref:hypothetical protein n=1 Tax=Ruminococcus flavefaciens TaxID=1265 RepID=UPI001A9A2C5A|nr:hypothetical protein [Ruminococcus flavefaciens]